ncbi:Fcf2 pre-rRNA processing-domain-containing protein [Russula earlei]|uniref:Fcf2 pre-rRNA processing-domain-containing protein n=1 Tax=Russula earlei TaxID=71964 RepID=A0ACC0U5A5_9AGAM|nr:Fcf2 pre-rRNA processing-domain-containing protein [Russula earlei]
MTPPTNSVGRTDFSTPSPTSSLDFYSEDEKDEVSQEYLNSLLEKARRSIAAKAAQSTLARNVDALGEDIIGFHDPESELKSLPPLDPGSLPPPYITLGETLHDAPLAIRDLDAERAVEASSSLSAPAPPMPPPELTNTGKPLTKKEKKALKERTAGPKWFDLPAPTEADLPRAYKEYEALRLRNQLDPKRFYRKDPGEGRGIKGLPKHFAIGTIVPTSTPFGGPSGDNLPRSARKRTIVDELVDDAEARHYSKRKFNELQSSRAAKGRGTLGARNAARKPKW